MDETETDPLAIVDVDSDCEGPAASVDRPQAVTTSLLDAAVEVFAEHGFEAARVAEIARRAGLTTGAIYARWPGKRALLVDAVGHVSAQFMDPSVGSSQSHAPETLASLGASLMDVHDAKSRDVMLEAFVSARRDGDFRAAVARSIEQDAERLDEIVISGQDEGSVDPHLSSRSIVAFFQSLRLGMHLVASASDMNVPRADWDALIARLVAAVGPAAPATGSPAGE
ncbi:MAG: helix-turn-helix domain containing protein [Acidimicrobiaceae bacterium]|nr:helix-turn-helix domain containing protein [Acidimicrobiaceae bacterium]